MPGLRTGKSSSAPSSMLSHAIFLSKPHMQGCVTYAVAMQVGTERRIFEMVLLWAEQAGLSGADLDPVLPHVRFPLMTPHQLQVCLLWLSPLLHSAKELLLLW